MYLVSIYELALIELLNFIRYLNYFLERLNLR